MEPLNEFEWIAKVEKQLRRRDPRVRVGIGDDAAVLRRSPSDLAVTTDALVEGVHFDLRYCSAEDVGHKALAVNLSDLAAMGAVPRFVQVSLALPPRAVASFLPGFYRGLGALARRFGVTVTGGNLSRSPGPIFVDVTAIGDVRRPLLRSAARPGESIGLIGALGEAAAGLALLERFGKAAAKNGGALVCAQRRPRPLVVEALRAAPYLSSAIDVSDGLVAELGHLAKASGVRLTIDVEALPQSVELCNAAKRLKRDPLSWILGGGEDYALLVTAPSRWRTRLAKQGVRWIGQVSKGKAEVRMRFEGQPMQVTPKGFDHFRAP